MVSKNILIQYSDLQKEIKYLSRKIDSLKNEQVKFEARKKRDMVRASSKQFPFIEHNVHIEGLADMNEIKLNSILNEEIRKLESRYESLVKVTNDVLDFIDSVDDSRMRLIISYRIIEGYSWNEVADAIGGGNTEDSVRMAFNRFMIK